MKYEKLIERLNQYQALSKSCDSVYCGGCGGLAFAVKRNMTDELRGEIDAALSEMSISDFKSAGDWGEFFHETNPAGVIAIFERETAHIEPSDIRQLDRYLLDARNLLRHTPEYKELLEQGISFAVDTGDDSLVETLSIVLGVNILNHTELFSLAMKKSKFNRGIHRVLYNFLREKVPEVRGYVGNGWGW